MVLYSLLTMRPSCHRYWSKCWTGIRRMRHSTYMQAGWRMLPSPPRLLSSHHHPPPPTSLSARAMVLTPFAWRYSWG